MNEQGKFLLYTAKDGAVKVEVFFQGETVWLTQKAIAELFGVKVPAINKHLKNIFESGELTREATVSKMGIVRPEGAREVARAVEFYNLDAIIAVGYRVNSYQATLHLEHEGNVRRELRAGAGRAIGQIVRNLEPEFVPDLHELEALGPAGDEAVQGETEPGSTAFPG